MSKKVKSAGRILDAMFGSNPEYQKAVVQERTNAQVARAIYKLRTDRKLTQKELAEMIGTKQSAISRLEDADYEGHSIEMLERIARALKLRMVFSFVEENDVEEATTYATGSHCNKDAEVICA